VRFAKIILEQVRHDDDVKELAKGIARLFALVKEVDGLEKNVTLQATVLAILQQAEQCALFIQQYAQNRFMSKCHVCAGELYINL
jgi:hypothetical protein